MSTVIIVCVTALNQDQETRLIDIMACCVHQASTGEYPPGRGGTHRKLTGKELKQARDDKYDLTEHFIEALPQLLSKVHILLSLSIPSEATVSRYAFS